MSDIKMAITMKGPCVDCGDPTENEFELINVECSMVPKALHRFHRCQECHDTQAEIDSAGMSFKDEPVVGLPPRCPKCNKFHLGPRDCDDDHMKRMENTN